MLFQKYGAYFLEVFNVCMFQMIALPWINSWWGIKAEFQVELTVHAVKTKKVWTKNFLGMQIQHCERNHLRWKGRRSGTSKFRSRYCA